MLVKRVIATCALVAAMSVAAMAAIERGIIIREAIIYVAPDRHVSQAVECWPRT